MVNKKLAQDYLKRAQVRFKALEILLEAKDYPDVIRESQEIVELLQKAILILMGIQPPKWHDTIDIILENKGRLDSKVVVILEALKRDSKWLRSQREIAFYGEIDFLPLEGYSQEDAQRAVDLIKKYFHLLDMITPRT